MKEFQPELGQRVRARRKQLRMTQTELGAPELSKSAISQIERGTLTPSLQALAIIAERLGVRISYLLGEDDAAPSAPRITDLANRLGVDEDTLRLALIRFLLD